MAVYVDHMRAAYLRSDSALWREFTAAARSVVGEWTDDQIAAVVKKVRGKSPDDLLESISQVFAYCGAAMKSGNEEAIATVELWQMADLPIEIMVEDGKVSHRLAPAVKVEIHD